MVVDIRRAYTAGLRTEATGIGVVEAFFSKESDPRAAFLGEVYPHRWLLRAVFLRWRPCVGFRRIER